MSAGLSLPPITVATDDYGCLMPLAKTLADQSHPLASPLLLELLRAELCEPDALPHDVRPGDEVQHELPYGMRPGGWPGRRLLGGQVPDEIDEGGAVPHGAREGPLDRMGGALAATQRHGARGWGPEGRD